MPDQFIVLLLIYLGVLSLVGFVLMGVDKKRAKENRWRISEKNLFLTAVIGGSAGVLLGMMVFRHKTKHLSFTIGIPMIILVQLFVLVLLLGGVRL